MINAKLTTELLDFINQSPTAFHAVNNSSDILKSSGYIEIFENEKWNLKKGTKYFLRRNNSSLIAFELGTDLSKEGFRIIGTHTDSPSFKIKPGDAIVTNDGYVKLNTECYGGTILSTWFDRPLSIAGRVIIYEDKICKERFININKPILMIPNLCIHFNRDINEGYKFNKQIDVLPILSFTSPNTEKQDYLLNLLSSQLNIEKSSIIDYDLFLYEFEKGCIMGMEDEFISASRLDNLWMTYAGLYSITNSKKVNLTKVFAAFDNEEIGSATSEGANSSYLTNILKRICHTLNLNFEETQIAFANSMALSADCAHAVHPNYGDKHDITNRPIMGKGLAIKYSAAQKYSTNAKTAANFINMCKSENIPYQKYVNRSDIIGGSTIGPAMSSLSSIPTVDVGIPILAMHSIREFGCIHDNENTIKAFLQFYEN